MSAILKKLIEDELEKQFGKNLYKDEPTNEMTKFAAALATAIQTYITANVITNPGQPVATAGGPTNQAGTTIGPGTVTAK
jgi:hypothetical protein